MGCLRCMATGVVRTIVAGSPDPLFPRTPHRQRTHWMPATSSMIIATLPRRANQATPSPLRAARNPRSRIVTGSWPSARCTSITNPSVGGESFSVLHRQRGRYLKGNSLNEGITETLERMAAGCYSITRHHMASICWEGLSVPARGRFGTSGF